MTDGLSYSDAGVDIDAGDQAVHLMKDAVAATRRTESVGDLGGFAGLFDISNYVRWRKPLLATSTDGVGTKLRVAQMANRHSTVGIDLVAMTVDDIVVCGAEPLYLTDYIACGRVVPEKIAEIVGGIADGCIQSGVALIGGETAEHPGVMAESEYDLSAAVTGIVEADEVLGAERVRPKDNVIALHSSGLHSNGYSLARKVFFEIAKWDLDHLLPESGRALGDELLEPTRIYAKLCLDLADQFEIRAFAHVTGGGICSNLQRVIPAGLTAVLDRGAWMPPAIFATIQGIGKIDRAEMERTFNMGIGMIAIVAPSDVEGVLAVCGSRGVESWVAGTVTSGDGNVRLEGSYRSIG